MKVNKVLPLIGLTKFGFTLIELLVVIAIIGVMSTIVISSLNNSRIKGSDAKVKTQLSGLRTAAELYYSENSNTYGATVDGTAGAGSSIGTGCANGMFADTKLTPYTLLINYPSYSNAGKCTSSGSAYAVSAKLNAANSYWCVDSRGYSKSGGVLQGDGVTTCP